MTRKTFVMIFLSCLILAGAWVPAQAQQPSFVGKWDLVIDLGTPENPSLFVYVVEATSAPAASEGNQSAPASSARGGGIVLGALNFGCTTNCRTIGFGWRHTPLTGANPVGVAMTFELPSPVAPGTFLLDGRYVNPNTVEGRAVLLADPLAATDPATINQQLNRVITVGKFTALRR
ncbi:MAG: hypothetical protein RMM98_10705 [Acidobacteriota bacterium]|nr:hypothetical protein [Blastocatellia bacterium]MDW8240076.1 hypothetical protein [Acidobacteriota bacterium]